MASDQTHLDRLGQLIRRAREERGWTQEQLADAAGVSRPSIQRYEGGRTANPETDVLRRVFLALRIDVRELPVALGMVTREEMGLAPEPPRTFAETTEEVIRILEDPDVPIERKREWVEFLRFRTAPTRTRKVS